MNSYSTPPPAHTRSAGRRGFSLVEVVIALGVVSFVLIALISLFSAGLLASSASQTDATRAIILRQTLAEVKTNTAVNLQAGSVSYDSQYDNLGQTNSLSPYYTCTVSVANASGTDPAMNPAAASNLFRITVRISYPPGASAANRITMTNYASISL